MIQYKKDRGLPDDITLFTLVSLRFVRDKVSMGKSLEMIDILFFAFFILKNGEKKCFFKLKKRWRKKMKKIQYFFTVFSFSSLFFIFYFFLFFWFWFFFTVCFYREIRLLQKTKLHVHSCTHSPPALLIKWLFLALKKKPVKKSFSFFYRTNTYCRRRGGETLSVKMAVKYRSKERSASWHSENSSLAVHVVYIQRLSESTNCAAVALLLTQTNLSFLHQTAPSCLFALAADADAGGNKGYPSIYLWGEYLSPRENTWPWRLHGETFVDSKKAQFKISEMYLLFVGKDYVSQVVRFSIVWSETCFDN
jgi:hypothetical protein